MIHKIVDYSMYAYFIIQDCFCDYTHTMLESTIFVLWGRNLYIAHLPEVFSQVGVGRNVSTCTTR